MDGWKFTGALPSSPCDSMAFVFHRCMFIVYNLYKCVLRHKLNVSCSVAFQLLSDWTESDNADPAGQEANRIVLRLARDTGTRSTERWQVLSLSDCESDQRVRTDKKPKLSLTIYKPGKAGKQRNKRKGRYKIKNLTDSASVPNKVTVPEYGASNDAKSQIAEDSKHTNVLAAECCNSCGVSNARISGTVSRRSGTARLFNRDSQALKENVFDKKCHDSKDHANINTRDDVGDNMGDKGNLPAVYCNEVKCTSTRAEVSETLLNDEEDSHHGVISCQESVHNGMFSLAADSVKIRKRRKVVPNSKSRKRCSKVKDEDNKTEAGETVDMASASESDKLNNNAACNSIVLSRRARPVRNRTLMNNCYVFTQLVKTTRRKRNSGKKPAQETIVNAECPNTTYSEGDSSQVENKSGVDGATNHTMIDSGELNCPIPDSKDTSSNQNSSAVEYTEHSSASNLHILDLVDNSSEGASHNDIDGSSSLLKPSPDILNTVSDTTHIPDEGSDTEVANAEKTLCTEADDCEDDNINCDTVANRDVTTAVTNSPPVDSYAKDEPVSDCQFVSKAENMWFDFSQLIKNDDITNDDTKVAMESGETLEVLSSPSTEVSGGADDSSDATEIWHTDHEISNLSIELFNGTCVPDPNRNGVDILGCPAMAVDHCNIEADETRRAVESICLLPANADDVEICADVLENCTELDAVDLITVDCSVIQCVKDDTDTADASNSFDNADDTKLLHQSACGEITEAFVTDEEEKITNEPGICLLPSKPDFTTAYDVEFSNNADDTKLLHQLACGEITEAFVTDKEEKIIDEPDTCLLPLKSDFATAYDIELSKNASEIVKISDESVASGSSVTTGECFRLYADAVTSTDTNGLIVNQSAGIELPTVSNVTSPDSSLPVEDTAGHLPRRSARRNVRSRWKRGGTRVEDLGHNYAKSAAESLHCREIHRQLTVDQSTDKLHKVRRKTSLNCRAKRKQLPDVELSKSASEISDASVALVSSVTASECHHDAVTSIDTNGLIVNQSTGIELPTVSTITSPDSSLPVEETAGHRRRRNARRNVRSRWKSGVTKVEELGHNYAKSSADSLNCRKKCKQLTDIDLSKNTSEIIKISDVSVASGLSITTRECHHLHADAITSTDTNGLIVNQSTGIELPAISTITSPDSSLPVEETADHRPRRNARRNVRSRSKSGGTKVEDDLGHNYAKSSAESLNCREKHRQLTVDQSTDKLHRVRRKTSECDSVEEIQGAEVKTVSSTAAGKKRHDASLRLLLLSTILLSTILLLLTR